MNERIRKLRFELATEKLDCILVSHPANRRYLSGFTGSAGFLIISWKEALLATDFRYIGQALDQSPDFQVHRIAGEFHKWLPGLIANLGIRRMAFESDDLSVFSYRQLVKAVNLVAEKRRPSLISTQGLVEGIRAIKDSEEISKIEKAAVLADEAIGYAQGLLNPGLSEKQLAWEIEKFLKERGSETMPFEIIVASGSNAALPHAQPGERVIKKGDPVVIDLGARLEGYASDITRTVFAGEQGQSFQQIYSIVLEAQQSAMSSIVTGMNGNEADLLGRKVISKAGYGEAFGHGLGHGVGLETHEAPRIGPNSKDVLNDGMVFTVEPGIYVPGWGGVRIEDMVLLEEGRGRVLTRAPK